MAGHSHWSGIKHKKGVADQKRGQAFSKLLAAISAAAKTEQNPEFNPRLRTAVEKAKEAKVPAENIARAIARATEAGKDLEELIFEAYGPGGTAILIEAIGDNKNRTVQEIKKILNEFFGKWAESGAVRWAFVETTDQRELEASGRERWVAKFPQALDEEERGRLRTLVCALEEQNDVQHVYTNAV